MGLQVWLPLTGTVVNQGLANVGTITNSNVTFDSAGKFGACASFNGSSSRLSITNFSIGNTWSYGCWFYSTSTSRGWEALVILNNNSGDADTQLGCYINSSGPYWQSTANGQYNARIPYSYANQWTHIFATFDGTTLTSYINGAKVNEKTITNALLSRSNLTIGARSSSASGGATSASTYFLGKISDVRIYDHCLTPKEVHNLAQGLVLHYMLNDGYVEGTANYLPFQSDFASWSSYGFGSTGTKTPTAGSTPNGTNYFCRVGSTRTTAGTTEMARWTTTTPALSSGGKATFSAYVRGMGSTIGKTGFLHVYNSNGSQTQSNTVVTFTFTGFWQRVSGQFTWTQSSASATSFSTYVCCQNMISGDTFDFCEPQFEIKDHVTPYVNGSRSQLTVYDSSGFGYHGTLQSGRNLSVLADTARYNASTKFPLTSSATGNYITLANATLLATLSSCTITWWGKYVAAKSLLITGQTTSYYLAAGNPSFYNGTGMTTVGWYVDGLPVTTPSYVAGAWHMYAWKGDIHTFTQFLLNNYGGGDTWSINGQIVDFRVYATALSDADVLELYHTSAEIAKDGTYFTRELIE